MGSEQAPALSGDTGRYPAYPESALAGPTAAPRSPGASRVADLTRAPAPRVRPFASQARPLPRAGAAPTMRGPKIPARPRAAAMSDAPLIRPARPADRAAVLALLAETFADTWRPQLTAQAVADYHARRPAERYVDAQLAQLLVAELDGEVLGFAGRSAGFVDSLHVAARGRRRGIARALMQALEAAMRGEGLALASLETDTFNTASQALYLALGYRETARYPDEEWNSGLTTIRYEKAL